MKTLLQIQTSMFSAGGQSSLLAEKFVAEWRRSNPNGRVIVRDIGAEPVPHLTAERFQSFLAKPEARTPEQHAVAGFSDELIEAIALQHTPSKAASTEFGLTGLLHVASRLAHLAAENALDRAAAELEPGYLDSLGLSGRLKDWQAVWSKVGSQKAA